MKVEVQHEVLEFQPTNLSIRFETKEEFEIFRHMMGYNLSIPTVVTRDSDESALLTRFMGKIYQEMCRHRTNYQS